MTRKEGDHHGDGDQEHEKNTEDLPETCSCRLQQNVKKIFQQKCEVALIVTGFAFQNQW